MQNNVENFLAQLYADPQERARFLHDPMTAAKAAGLSEWECAEVSKISPHELARAAGSFDRKREVKKRHRRLSNVRRLLRWIKDIL
ncbi:MAG TPA: hypothetical protein VNW97_16045 [Candidatus Saccharimonadales bacterium]|jgi:hypothetical protein|nr:hypothetical protein [Candidatus Saccharimonadales bacterium]